jgi:lipopolysaccharide transport system ATP-binding protein
MKEVIEVKNVDKLYKLGEISTGTFTKDVENFFKKMLDSSYNENFNKQEEYNYSLKNVSFKLNEGDALGVVGKNGAGKSTLLKILSRVTSPTSGSIKINGRVASLLEVGTGFHPELTGRENIFLNGAILGMRKKEISKKLDEIIDFSGVEKFIDTPVKRYSSGMYVRLAFAVAAHLDSEILFLDEVLAVGDFEFQKKCISKVNNLNMETGKTIIFVSHNMSLIESICNKSLLLVKGEMKYFGTTNEVLDKYKNQNIFSKLESMDMSFMNTQYLEIYKIYFNGIESNIIEMGRERKLNIKIIGRLKQKLKISFEVRILDEFNKKIFFYCPTHINGILNELDEGDFEINETILFPETITTSEYIFQMDMAYPGTIQYWGTEERYKINFDGFLCKTGLIYSYSDSVMLLGNN